MTRRPVTRRPLPDRRATVNTTPNRRMPRQWRLQVLRERIVDATRRALARGDWDRHAVLMDREIAVIEQYRVRRPHPGSAA